MSKPIILVDMDGVCADLIPDWLALYNAATGRTVTLEDITKFEMSDNADMGQVIYEHLQTPGLFLGLKPLPGAIEALKELNDSVGRVCICSTPSRNPDSAAEKLKWCKAYLPFIPRRQVILCGMKELVRGDYLIEDSPENVEKWGAENPRGTTLLIDYPYNRGATGGIRVHGYQDTVAAWRQIVSEIRFLEALRKKSWTYTEPAR